LQRYEKFATLGELIAGDAMSHQKGPSTRVGSRVRFEYQGRELTGVVARLDRAKAFVLGDDRQSYQVPRNHLLSLQDTSDTRVPEKAEQSKDLPQPVLSPSTLHPGDRVLFTCRGKKLAGRIARLNARRAHVVCDNDDEYAVPYPLLTLKEAACDPAGFRSEEKLTAVVRLAERLLAEHGLTRWSFDFDHASRRAGSCQYRRRRITVSLQFARQAPEEEILDTLLHEIAHALVGPKHNHNAVWQAKAREIGASGERCHDRRFTPPRYIVQCRNGCWTATAERRRRNVVCSKCRGEIVYQTYTAERWRELQPSS
jgi:predicted SprT family Zn-dependent metalloprotease